MTGLRLRLRPGSRVLTGHRSDLYGVPKQTSEQTSKQMSVNACIYKIFTQFDRDNSGAIDKGELHALAIALGDELSPAELADMFKSVDTDNSGQITWEEFITYWDHIDK